MNALYTKLSVYRGRELEAKTGHSTCFHLRAAPAGQLLIFGNPPDLAICVCERPEAGESVPWSKDRSARPCRARHAASSFKSQPLAYESCCRIQKGTSSSHTLAAFVVATLALIFASSNLMKRTEAAT